MLMLLLFIPRVYGTCFVRGGGGGGGDWGLFARIFSPALDTKSSGFARILLAFFAQKWPLKYSRGTAAPSPPPRPVRLFTLLQHLYYYKNQGCLCVCVSCLCRPPSHWWISFTFYTIIGLDPEGGQWLFKLQSYNNYKNYRPNRAKYLRHRYTPQNSICGTVVKYRSTYPIKYDVTSCVLRVHAVVVVWLRVTVSAVSDLWYRILSLALKMKWSVQCQWREWPWKWIGQWQWSEFWAGMRFLDFKLSCIASRRANISWAIRSSSTDNDPNAWIPPP